jgi:hypothetical protein
MSDQQSGIGPGTDISAADLDVEANDEVSETSDADAYDDDGTLGGMGGAEQTSGGAG